jgi:hypothetical protein
VIEIFKNKIGAIFAEIILTGSRGLGIIFKRVFLNDYVRANKK